MMRTQAGLAHWQELCAALEAEPGSAYLLSPELTIQYVNEGWRRFAEANGAPELAARWPSTPVTESLSQPLRELFSRRFLRVLENHEPWTHTYECSSSDTYRKFHMRVEPMRVGGGLIVVHSLVAEAPRSRESALDGRITAFTSSRGLIVQCSSCGRLRLGDNSARWDWAPGLITEQTPNVSHGICSVCEFQHYRS